MQSIFVTSRLIALAAMMALVFQAGHIGLQRVSSKDQGSWWEETHHFRALTYSFDQAIHDTAAVTARRRHCRRMSGHASNSRRHPNAGAHPATLV